jgi:nucleotide-binding universal stress UspA family protein
MTDGIGSSSIEAGSVVVGIDGSDRSRPALKWAADEARRRSVPLLVLYAQLDEPEDPPAWYASGTSAGSAGQAVIDDAVGLVATRHPSLPVHGRVVEWPAAMVLTTASRTAGLLVVGARGLGGFKELLLGSVSDQCIQYAHGPVAVVHGVSDDPPFESAEPRLVVGFDGSPGSFRALRWALEEARTRRASVEAVFARNDPAHHPEVTGPVETHPSAAEEIVAAATAHATELAPGVGFRAESYDRPALAALVEASGGADLLVVGSEGHGALHEAFLGSVAHRCARHATCPVVVVRPRYLEEDRPGRARGRTGVERVPVSSAPIPTAWAGR